MTSSESTQECAARWLLRREEPDWSNEDELALKAWLDASLSHKAAFWRLEHGWRQASRLGALKTQPARHPSRGRWQWRIATAASIAIAVAVSVIRPISSDDETRVVPPQEVASFATAVGARKKVSLQDGSTVELNTHTVVKASVTSKSREFWLTQGEAFFDVVHAPAVPFVVHAAETRIVVLGTKFSVRAEGDRVTVGVLEGRVTIGRAKDARLMRSATIGTGDIAVSRGQSTLVVANSPQRVENGISWRSGMLTFDGATLAEVAAEFNRYNHRKLVVASPEIAGLRIGGSFQSSNEEAFLRLMNEAYGLQTRESGNEVEILAPS
jgi:transmembrane sensor